MTRSAARVYAIRCGTAFKIGVSTKPNTRLRQIQVHNPNRLKIDWLSEEMSQAKAAKLESDLHVIFNKHRISGEWFRVNKNDVVEAAAQLLSGQIEIDEKLSRKRYPDKVVASFPKGTFARIAMVLEQNQTRTDFIREAIEHELKRRERQAELGGEAGAARREQEAREIGGR